MFFNAIIPLSFFCTCSYFALVVSICFTGQVKLLYVVCHVMSCFVVLCYVMTGSILSPLYGVCLNCIPMRLHGHALLMSYE